MVLIGQLDIPGEMSFLIEGPVDKHGKTDLLMTYIGVDEEDLEWGETFVKTEVEQLLPKAAEMSYDRALWSETTKAGGNFPGNLVRAWTGYLFSENNTEDVWKDISEQFTTFCQEYYPFVYVDIELWGGHISQVAVDATAFAYRNALFNVGIVILLPADEKHAHKKFKSISDKADLMWTKLSKYFDGVYTNYQVESLSGNEYAWAYWGGQPSTSTKN
jgi:hypothetical protein